MRLCPCGSKVEYNLCCQPYLNGKLQPNQAVQLMRSRYTAFVMRNTGYLLASWHPTRRYPGLESELLESLDAVEWLELTIFEEAEGAGENEAYVGFVARFQEKGKRAAIIERSRFLKENNQWYYVDGIRPSFGRNNACPCGSGQKFKKCCGQ